VSSGLRKVHLRAFPYSFFKAVASLRLSSELVEEVRHSTRAKSQDIQANRWIELSKGAEQTWIAGFGSYRIDLHHPGRYHST